MQSTISATSELPRMFSHAHQQTLDDKQGDNMVFPKGSRVIGKGPTNYQVQCRIAIFHHILEKDLRSVVQ